MRNNDIYSLPLHTYTQLLFELLLLRFMLDMIVEEEALTTGVVLEVGPWEVLL